jgi:protein gp37
LTSSAPVGKIAPVSERSNIEWTDTTWNPVVGCAHVPPGCDNCYAAREASGRLKNVPIYTGLTSGGKFTGEVRPLHERLDQPLKWRKPRMIFVNSMSDLFHSGVPMNFIVEVFAVMAKASHHTFQILTKRPQRMKSLLGQIEGTFNTMVHRRYAELCGMNPSAVTMPWPLPNVWLGTSIESDTYAFRANYLRKTPAAVRFISAEPLL